jgi:hypothetical protein
VPRKRSFKLPTTKRANMMDQILGVDKKRPSKLVELNDQLVKLREVVDQLREEKRGLEEERDKLDRDFKITLKEKSILQRELEENRLLVKGFVLRDLRRTAKKMYKHNKENFYDMESIMSLIQDSLDD